MALFKNMAITEKGMALYAKAQAGQPIVFTKMRVGSGNLGTQNPATLLALIDGKLDVPISSITPNPELKSATIVGNITNTGILEAMYICEIGIFATDPDEGEILYGYSNCGSYGDYYAPEAQGPYSWQYQISAAIGNAANVTAELTQLNYDYGIAISSTNFIVLSGGNQKEVNKSIDLKLKSHADSIAEIGTQLADLASQEVGKGASLIGVNDSTGLFTATDVEGALKEAIEKANSAFTSASNGKQEVVTAITGVDPNVTIPAEPTFQDLATAIGSISTGIKYATGEVASIGGYGNVTINGLDFVPKMVLVEAKWPQSTNLQLTNVGYFGNDGSQYDGYVLKWKSGHIGAGTVWLSIDEPSTTAFTIRNSNSSTATTVKWLALKELIIN